MRARSIALFKIGTCVLSVACSRMAQSSAESAQTGISSLLSTESSSVATKFLINMSVLLLCNSSKACLYSPLESINTNFDPLAA